MEAPSTGVFLANAFGVVVTSALSYVWTAAAVVRSQAKSGTWSTSDGSLENGCDVWLHECATSSADGTYTQAKEAICAMAAPEHCSPYFEEKGNPGRPNRRSSSRKQQGPAALGGRSPGYAALTSGVPVAGNPRISATISVSKMSVLLAWNTLGWIAVYIVCRVAKRAWRRGLREARVETDGADGNPAAVDGNGVSGGSGAVPVVAVVAAGEGAAAVGGSSEKNIAVNEGVQQASIPSGSGSSAPLRGGRHDADPDPAVGDSSNSNGNEPAANNRKNEKGELNNKDESRGSSSIGPGRGSPNDLKACSAVSPDSPISAPLCERSPGRVGPSTSKSQPPFPHDISSATKGDSPVRARSKSDVGAKSREMSGNGLSRSHKVPFMIDEGKGKAKTRRLSAPAEGARCFDSAVEVASFPAAPPDLASPPNVRSGLFNRADAVKALSAPSPGYRINSPGRAKSMGEGVMSDNGEKRDTGLASPAPVFPAAGAGAVLSTPTSSKAEASGGDNREEGGGNDHPVQHGSATNGQRTFSEAERDLRHLIGLGSPDASAPAIPPVPGSDGRDSAHSDEPVPDASGPATPGSGPPVLDTLFLGPPSSSSTSTTYSACWIVLPEGANNTTSLQGLSDLDVGVASSAGGGGELTQYILGGFGGSIHDDQMSTHDILDQGVDEMKGGSEEPHGNWAPPVGVEDDRLGFDAFLLEDSDGDQSRSDGVGVGAAEGKGPAPCQTRSTEIARQLQVHARSDGIGGGVLEEKGAPPNPLPPPDNEQVFELAPRAWTCRRESGDAEEKGSSTYRMSSTEKDGYVDAHTGFDRIEGGGTEESGARASSTTNTSFGCPQNPDQNVNHAPMPSRPRSPPDGNHNTDGGNTISGCKNNDDLKPGYNIENSHVPGKTGSSTLPGQSACIRPGGLSPSDLKPCSDVLPDSPRSALLCNVSPRRGEPSPSKSRSSLLHDISGCVQRNLHSAPVSIDEGVAGTDTRERAVQREGARSFGSAVEETALTATSPGFASPASLRLAKLGCSKSVAQVTPVRQSSLPSKNRSGDIDLVTSNSIAVPANASGNDGRDFSRTISSGGAESVGQDVERDNEWGRETILAMTSTVLPPAGPSAAAESKTAFSCHMSSAETEAEIDPPPRSKGMGGGVTEEKERSPYRMSPVDTELDFGTPARSVRIERDAPKDTGGSPCAISPAETVEGPTYTPILAKSSGIANLTGADRMLDKAAGGHKSLTSRTPLPPPTGSNCAATAPICSETKASGEGSSGKRDTTDGPVSSSRATNDGAMQCLEAERELRTVLGLRLPDISALADTLGTEPEASSTHSSALISGGPANEASVADGPESQAQVSGASASNGPAPCTPGSDVSASNAYSPPFSTYSACGTVLPEGFTKDTSPGGVSNLDVGMSSSAGRGSALTQSFDGGHSGPLHHGNVSSRETVDHLGEKSTGGSVESPSISAPPIETNDHHLGLDVFPLAHSDDGHPRSDGIAGGVAEEEKGPSSDQRPSAENHIEIDARVHVPFCQTTPCENGPELDPHARSEVVGRGAGGESGPSAQDMSSAEKERELKMVLGLIPACSNAQTMMGSEDAPTPTSSSEPRWGNLSTTVPLEERQRRDQELFDAVQCRQETETEDEWVEAQPASFPDESTWPSGEGFAELDGPGDRLPPPSDYEVQESAKMYARYEEAMRELGIEP